MTKSKKLIGAAGIALATAFGTMGTAVLSTAAAQNYTTGALRGGVVDENGTAISGASVTVTNTATGLSRSVTTSGAGAFSISALPGGSYDVTVSASGYSSFEDTISINIGDATGLTFTLFGGDVITVSGTATSLVDFSSPETSFSINVDELADSVPVARDIGQVALLAPSTSLGDGAFQSLTKPNVVNISGSSVGENAYYINGFNITDFRNFLGASTIPFEFYDNLSVKTAGLPAEFGRFSGGALIATTKSGSNEFKFGVNAFIEPDSLRSQQPDTYLSGSDYYRVYNSADEADRTEANVYVSGPIIKDRLFFYGIYNVRDFQSKNVTGEGLSTDEFQLDDRGQDDPFYGLNLDFYLTDRQQFEFTYIKDEQTAEITTFDFDVNSGVGAEVGVTNQEAGGEIYIFNYNGQWTDWLNISAMYGEQTFSQTTQASTDANPAIYDSRTGGLIALGNWANLVVESGADERVAYRADADIFINDFLGDHTLRVGFDREELNAVNATQYSGGIYYRYFAESSGTCQRFVDTGLSGDCVRVRELDSGGSYDTIQSAWYIQDQWEVNQHLTLNLGVRIESFENKNANGEAFAKIDNTVAPRLGFVYDPTGEGQSRFFANWGQYYLPVAANTNIRLAGAEFFTQTFYNFSSINADDTPVLGAQIGQDVFGTGEIPDARTVRDKNLDPFYVEEILLGYETFIDDYRFGLRYVNRELTSLIEDAAVDAGMLRYCDANGISGCEDIWSGFHSYVLVNPGSSATFFTDELPGQEGTFVEVTLTPEQLGLPEGERSYNAVTAEFERKFDGVWGLQGSYTWAEISGNYEGTVKSDNGQDDAGITQDFDNEGLTDGANGELPQSHTHTLKLFGSYQPMENVLLGANFLLQSPRKYGCIGTHPTDPIAEQYGQSSWYCDLSGANGTRTLTPRGSVTESDWLNQLDLTAAWRPETEFGQFEFRVDIFNVLDADAGIDIDEYGLETDVADGGVNTFGVPLRYQRPRTVRLSVGYDF